MVEPQVQPLIGFPAAWTPGTKGTVIAPTSSACRSTARRTSRSIAASSPGKIVLTQPERAGADARGHRSSSAWATKDFDGSGDDADPAAHGGAGAAAAARGGPAAAARRRAALAARIAQFYKAEGVVAIFNRGSDAYMASVGSDLSAQQQHTDGGTIFPTGNGSRGATPAPACRRVTLAVEHYNRMVRVLAKNMPVKVELNVETKFYDETTPNGFNTIAEIPGSDPALRMKS